MANFAVFKEDVASPLLKHGFTHPFWSINKETIIATWVVMTILLALVIASRIAIKKEGNIAKFLLEGFVKNFRDLVNQTLGEFHFRHFTFIASIFVFIITCNFISLIPGIEEPTNDIMTTLALGITAFIYTQASSIEVNGFMGYLKGYLEPFFIMMPLNVVSNLATIVSISFRLFGNIFGGSVISGLWYSAIGSHVLTEIVGILSGINFIITIFFVLFEGFIQAFVFSMLSLTYLSIEVKGDKPDNAEEATA